MRVLSMLDGNRSFVNQPQLSLQVQVFPGNQDVYARLCRLKMASRPAKVSSQPSGTPYALSDMLSNLDKINPQV